MSWHIPRSLVNELISAQREQLNTGFLLLSLANRGDGESAGRGRGDCASFALTRVEVIVMHLEYIFVLLVLSSRALVCLIRMSQGLLFLARECSSSLTRCYRSRGEVQLCWLCEGICMESFCPSKQRKLRYRRIINPSCFFLINCVSRLIKLQD